MATIQNFQELDVWKTAKELSVKIFKTFRDFKSQNEALLVRQMIRSAVSVPSNIAEGFEREGNKEFIQFLSIAKGSNGELMTQIIIAYEIGMIDKNEFSQISVLSNRIGVMLKKLMHYLENTNYRGQKFNTNAHEKAGIYNIEITTNISELNKITTIP
jgi:four helix bundle protein